jgi:3'-phosphoadenosine 5'-phosphosulfate sulfotransferase (PAPS reductase)/FAD synthetase
MRSGIIEANIISSPMPCSPCTATTLPEVIQEMLLTTTSERQGRAIDHDQTASMEKKKQEGYF